MSLKEIVMPWHVACTEALSCWSMKVLKRVIEGRVRKIIKIDSMQFGGFMAGRSMTAIFIVHIWQRIKNYGWLL